MGFWIFMLIMDLLLPFTMIGFGRYFMKKAPKEINSVFGYRTSMSMKNKDTWEFAHKYCGDLTILLVGLGFHCFLLKCKEKLRHSLGRPSRSDFVQLEAVNLIVPKLTVAYH